MTQCDAILEHLRAGRPLTPMEALERFGCFRLAARIDDLKRDGHDIQTDIVKAGGKRWASYRLRLPVQRELFAESRVGL